MNRAFTCGRCRVRLRQGARQSSAADLRADITASVVVSLVALPLCVGVAVASGVPAELGLVTGIVGGLVTGLLPGSSLQVSGPAAGLTVLVLQAVNDYGVGALGFLVLAAGVIQLVLGALGLGRWFRAISLAVVEGMLAGIGLILVVGQLYPMADQRSPGSVVAGLTGLPRLFTETAGSPHALTAACLGAGTIAVMALWKHLPRRVRSVPSALVAVALSAALATAFRLPVERVDVQGLAGAIRPPSADALGRVAEVGALGTVLAIAVIASAESLFGAAAVDRLHTGPTTDYDKELLAQGVGNTVCGALGALPMTAVIVRSSANVQAGARTKVSRVLHGVWLLLFTALIPGALGLIPLASLAGVLVCSGWRLVPWRRLGPLWRRHRGEALVLAATAIGIVTTSMFEGVLAGLTLAVLKTAWEMSDIRVRVDSDNSTDTLHVTLSGNATFLQLPRILGVLDRQPKERTVELDLRNLQHLDHTCRTTLDDWLSRHNGAAARAAAHSRRSDE
ncbi:SulP family inorganic anion transporter [Streptomyces sp. bgisy100]|uniref:SulP family inorganic anion transporter n=1 Tax=Streptomyces sp. bgisy100 TaxID=3413783 RepID=UPI003D70464A